jgi:predicted metal-dependent hydrolase
MNESGIGSRTYRKGIELFNGRRFFDAHEVLEDVWRENSGPEKSFLQGLVQLAVAFHHHSTGNSEGARSLLQKAHKNLSGYPQDFGGIRLGVLLKTLSAWQSALEQGVPPPPLPRL